jgi:hypothetical protein
MNREFPVLRIQNVCIVIQSIKMYSTNNITLFINDFIFEIFVQLCT